MFSNMPRPSSTALTIDCEVVVGQYHVRGLLGHVGASDAHGDADVGRLDGRGVIDPVSGHRHDLTSRLPGADDPQLVLG